MSYTEQVQKFLKKSWDKQKCIVIYGPTGSGKTSMSIEIAKLLNTEIISTDSRQIFQYMDIGTGKITSEEMQWVKHHMLDIIQPDTVFSVGDFREQALNVMNELYSKNKIPMLVGWTGLYINSIIFDFKLPGVIADVKLRKQLDMLSIEELYAKLVEIDPEYAKELHPNNRPYVERAIEVKLLTGKSKTEFREEKKLVYDVLFLTPDYGEREELYNRINKRVEIMFEQWAEQEVKKLLNMWYKETDFGMNSIGYREFFPYFKGEVTKQETISQIQQNSRNYAKRQCTWFRKYEKYIDIL